VEYIYLVASLPMLQLATPPRLAPSALLASADGVLRNDHLEDLRAVLEDRPEDVRAPEARPYLDADVQLRNALARLRAARAGAAYDPGAHPHADYDARCDEVAARAMELEDPLARELLLDELRWTLLDELSVRAPYGIQGVLAYGFKLRLAEKWSAQVDAAEGMGIAARLTDEALVGISL
jgi:hypothetical protein